VLRRIEEACQVFLQEKQTQTGTEDVDYEKRKERGQQQLTVN
jgi:hypothetical protein